MRHIVAFLIFLQKKDLVISLKQQVAAYFAVSKNPLAKNSEGVKSSKMKNTKPDCVVNIVILLSG